jgi:RecA/RadA recombinase
MSKNKEEEKIVTPQDQLLTYLKGTKGEHYNFEESVYYKVSTGSLLLDSVFNGGFDAGLVRLVGHNGGGKTSEAFELAKNFMKSVSNSRAMYIKAEGRLSKDMMARTGMTFITGDTAGWINGTCYVHESNIFQNILGLIQELIHNNPLKIKYCFILDSLDGVITRGDREKTLDENAKVAGAPSLSKRFFQQCAVPLFKFGHLPIFISQVSANISIDPKTPAPVRIISGTGGNSLLHMADIILDFGAQFQGDLILENPNLKPDPIKNKILGHWCKIEVKKSPNETKGQKIQYPIRHGKGIWRELEISDYALMKGLLIRAGAWYSFEDSTYKELKKMNKETPLKFQGINDFHVFLEENPEITQYLFNLFVGMISAEGSYNRVEETVHETP